MAQPRRRNSRTAVCCFVAKVPSVGYAVYDVEPAAAAASNPALHVTASALENARYRVRIDPDGDIASIFDKSTQKELLSAPARLAISYDNPTQWPAWNMDWDQEQAPPRSYVSGPATHSSYRERPGSGLG